MWALVAACAVFWLLRFVASPLQAPPQTTAVSTALAVRGDLQRLLGAPPAAQAPLVAESAGRFKLIGVMAPRPAQADSGQGIALLTVDDKPPRAFRVGAAVEGDWFVQAVSTRAVTLAGPPSAAPIRLELPPLAAPTTGQLPSVSLSSAAPTPPSVPRPVAPTPVAPPPPSVVPGAVLPQADPGAPPTLYTPPEGSVLPANAR